MDKFGLKNLKIKSRTVFFKRIWPRDKWRSALLLKGPRKEKSPFRKPDPGIQQSENFVQQNTVVNCIISQGQGGGEGTEQ